MNLPVNDLTGSGSQDHGEPRNPAPPRLSKTSIAGFEQCAKKLWLKIHRPEAARYDPATLQLFASGHLVGELARKAYPSGIMVEEDHHQLLAAIATTRRLMDRAKPQPIFEAAFHHANVVVRADILEPAGPGAWRLTEVKNSGRVRPAFVSDLATQAWVLAGAGVSLSGVYLRHPVEPLRPWRRQHAVRFVDVDLGAEVRSLIGQKAEIVRSASEIAAGAMPDIVTGLHCSAPYRCEFREFCRSSRPNSA